MKVQNINEEIPDAFYVFIGLGKSSFSQVNYHNYQLSHRLISSGISSLLAEPKKISDFIQGNIKYAPFVLTRNTLNSPSSHMMNIINSYHVEYILEYYRPKEFPSRFSCLYAFGDYESCLKACELYPKMFDKSKIKRFRLKKLNNDLDKCIKVAKCNMEIVSRMWNCDISLFGADSIRRIANAYWSCQDKVATEIRDIDTGLMTQHVTDVLYEYLIEGILEEIQ